ncbi:MAG: polysaccharide biosynthesis/export family protein [bacterium]
MRLLLVISLLFVSGCASDSQRLERVLASVRAEEFNVHPQARASESQVVRIDEPMQALPPAVPTPARTTVQPEAVKETEKPVAPQLVFPSTSRVTIQPETVVEVMVAEDPILSGTYEVNAASAIMFRYVGLVFLGNLTAPEARIKIKNTLEKERGFRVATVEVKIVRASYDTVRVSGWVNEPGDLRIGPGSDITLTEALLRAKGLRAQAKGIKIGVARGGLLNPVPLTPVKGKGREEYSLVGPNGEESVPSVPLRGNDWVHIFPGDEQPVGLGEKQVVVVMVDQPGVVRFSNNEPCTMIYLLAKVGKLSKWIDTRRVLVLRKDKNGNEEEIKVDVRPILEKADSSADVALEHGDRVIFKERRFF